MGCQNENDIDAKTAGVFFGALMSAEHDMFAPTVLLLFDAWHRTEIDRYFPHSAVFCSICRQRAWRLQMRTVCRRQQQRDIHSADAVPWRTPFGVSVIDWICP